MPAPLGSRAGDTRAAPGCDDSPVRLRRGVPLAAVAAVAAGVAGAVVPTNDVGPASRLQPSGRLLLPPGKLTTLGNHPGGGALTRNARFLWTLSAGRGRNDIRIIEVAPPIDCPSGQKGAACRAARQQRVGRLVQVIPMPGVDGGITMARHSRTAYVSGIPESDHKDQQTAAGTPGKGGDVIHVFHYDGKTGLATGPAWKRAPKVKARTVGAHLSHPGGIAADPRADRAYVAVAGEDRVAALDTKAMSVRRQLSLRRSQGIGVEPTQVATDPYGCYLTSADSGEDAVALFRLRDPCTIKKDKGGHITVSGTQLADPRLLGRVPTASYPVMATPEPHLKKLAWVAAKGFGVGPNPT